MNKSPPGVVYLVGAGPGDPQLITVKGLQMLRRADVVIYDHLISPRLLESCPSLAKRVYVGKQASRHTLSQEAINRLLVRQAMAGRLVVRLKGGDPYLFGRGAEEALALAKAHIAYEVVPGVTSALAVPAYAGIPVTHRRLSSAVAIITGHEDPAKSGSAIAWDRLATACDTLVFLMGVKTLPQIAARLIQHGRSAQTPCAVIAWGTTAAQQTVIGTLKTIAAQARRAAIPAPAILVVGEVVRLRSTLNWFETKPLFGTRILVTRTSEKAQTLAEQLEALGASVDVLPAIELAPVKANGVFREAMAQMPRTDWVFFTSPEGIGWFSRMLKPYRKDLRALAGCHIGAIGSKTAAAIEEAGLHVDFVPTRFSQEGMVEQLPPRLLRGKRALIFSAQESRDVLSDGLRRHGMTVTKVPVYRTIVPAALTRQLGRVLELPHDFVTATSASCVEHVYQACAAMGQQVRFRMLRFASIGPVTSAAVRARGGRVTVEARSATIEGLVEAMRRAARHRPARVRS